jgi:maltoporin
MKVPYLKQALLAAGVLAVGHTAMAGVVDYTGYFRAQAGHNSEQGKQACFGLAGAGSKYRLGNECGVYGELTLNNDIAKTDDGAVFSAHVMFSIFNNTASNQNLSANNGGSGNLSDGQFGLPQVYLKADGVPELGGASAWMGRRYYKREDLHITDFFYWNPQGFGAGIEDLPVGDGMKFSYAILRNDDVASTFTAAETGNTIGATGANGTPLGGGNSATRHDLQLRGLKVNDGGTLEFGLAFIQADSKAPNTKNGTAVTIQHRQAGIFGGENKLALQFMNDAGVANGGTGNITPSQGLRRVRVVEGLYFQPTPTFGGQLVGVYQNDTSDKDNDASAVRWTTLGGRLAIGLTSHFKLNMDLGFDTAQPKGGQSGNLMKFTIAPTLSVGPAYYGRPELRLFYTYGKWNDAARTNAGGLNANGNCLGVTSADPISACGVFGGKDNGSVIGFSAESWW